MNLPSFATAGTPGAKYIVGSSAKATPNKKGGGHQTLLSGYATLSHGTYYLVHNSWGPKWGDGGYAWLHEETLKPYLQPNNLYVVDVEPMQVAIRKHKAHGKLTPACNGAEVPDSI